jgi:hypothetical protein
MDPNAWQAYQAYTSRFNPGKPLDPGQEKAKQSPKSRVVPNIRPFLISGIRPDIRFHLPDIRLAGYHHQE